MKTEMQIMFDRDDRVGEPLVERYDDGTITCWPSIGNLSLRINGKPEQLRALRDALDKALALVPENNVAADFAKAAYRDTELGAFITEDDRGDELAAMNRPPTFETI